MILVVRKRAFSILIIGGFTFLVLYSLYIFSVALPELHCYHHKTRSLPSIAETKPARGKSIFFHETSCASYENGKIVINARQACAVESAARMNPNFEIYLLYVSPGEVTSENETESGRFLRVLLDYGNIYIRHINFEEYVEGTPVDNLYKEGKIEASRYPTSHASDVLRYLTLWKYGGIYLDLDTIVIKSLEHLPLNFAGAQSYEENLVASGVLSFQPSGVGHILAQKCLTDLKFNFDGTVWGGNGPDVITRLAKEVCANEYVDNMVGTTCVGDFKVYPPETFYRVPWQHWDEYFKATEVDALVEKANESLVLHFWNKLSVNARVPVGTDVAYTRFAKVFCPEIYNEVKGFF